MNDFVDPDALDRLFLEQTGDDLELELRVNEFLVTVREDGSLGVRRPEGPGRTSPSAEAIIGNQL